MPCKDGKKVVLRLQRCRGVWKSLLVILQNGDILIVITAVGSAHSYKYFRFVQTHDVGIAVSFRLILVGIVQVGNVATDFALQMSYGGLDMLVVGDGQSPRARLIGLQGNLEIDVIFFGRERHLLLVPIVELEGYLIATSLHVLSQEYQVGNHWWRSHKEIEEGLVESEILELALAVVDGYRLADADLALIESQDVIHQSQDARRDGDAQKLRVVLYRTASASKWHDRCTDIDKERRRCVVECLHLQAFVQHIAEKIDCRHIAQAVVHLLDDSFFEVGSHIADDILHILLIHAPKLLHHLGDVDEVKPAEACNRDQQSEVLFQFLIALFIVGTL